MEGERQNVKKKGKKSRGLEGMGDESGIFFFFFLKARKNIHN